MQLIVNGKAMTITSMRVDALLRELEYEGTHYAVAVNYRVVPRARWNETELRNGDKVEILTPRQGG
ncbi:sulfur carrier protein ThiS [Pseudorhodoplanes sp.]|uniref:sulfur carrier protein ThiS n=1 Tax=Pseudorhodoplanes sp. TaxID=1934341 RepID=UPI00391A1FDE